MFLGTGRGLGPIKALKTSNRTQLNWSSVAVRGVKEPPELTGILGLGSGLTQPYIALGAPRLNGYDNAAIHVLLTVSIYMIPYVTCTQACRQKLEAAVPSACVAFCCKHKNNSLRDEALFSLI